MAESVTSARDRIWQTVAAIPKGKVATFGQIAGLSGMPSHARLVGKVLSQLPPGSRIPWHRVLNAQGRISCPSADEQRRRLEAEDVVFLNGRVRLKDYQWVP